MSIQRKSRCSASRTNGVDIKVNIVEDTTKHERKRQKKHN